MTTKSRIEITEQELKALKMRIVNRYERIADHCILHSEAEEAAEAGADMALTVDEVICWLEMF